MVRYAIISASIAFLVGCTDDPGPADAGSGDAAPDARMSGCISAADCSDNVACTEDTCEGGACAHRPTISRCAAGSVCDARRGCQPGRACATSDDCRDTDPCTVNERCDPAARLCVSDALEGDRDGHVARSCGGDDCDDSDIEVAGGATEYCNGRDDDC
ncbi:MAG: hypothetical protein Q8M76_07195, partial [Spirochaetaceae bacterium]|nr:hypothetical protein [Spirochaetaceae bacterium]